MPENSGLAIAIRLKGHPVSIRRPHRRAIGPAKRQTLREVAAGKLVDPDAGLLVVRSLERNPLSIARDARRRIRPARQLEWPAGAVAVDEHEIVAGFDHRR